MIPVWLKNKYILTAGLFAVWMLFFDTRDVITTHFRQRGELNRLLESKAHYQLEIEKTRKELEQLKSDPRVLEKYAREKYRMKKDNEDLYVISANPIQ
jgi:cell division protein FtsB